MPIKELFLHKLHKMKNLVVIENITKKYDTHTALNRVSMEIPKGSIFGLLGPNGAGKTSFIRILNQIVFPDSGEIFFNEEKLSQKHISKIGYLPEERGLYKNMKVGEQILYLAQLKGLSKKEANKQMDFWFNRLEISHWKNKKIQELSKGMAQKVQFVATVLHRPELLIFDEIFSGLDPISAEVIKNQILYLKKEGATIIFSTHRMESVEEMCDHIVLLNQSEKILEGKVSDIKKQFKTNVFQVGILSENKTLFQELSQVFEVEETVFNSLYNELKISIKKPEAMAMNELISFLLTKGQITHFSEVIPSVNDIFIKAVKQNNF